MELEKLGKGDRILFNDRKIPVEVEEVDENRVHIQGPHGGEYIIFPAEETDDLLVRNKTSSRKYASYVEGLRKVGEWEREEDTWKHSKTGKEVQIKETGTGFWTIETDLDVELDLPKYGFSSKEFAEEKAEEVVEKYPEGKI